MARNRGYDTIIVIRGQLLFTVMTEITDLNDERSVIGGTISMLLHQCWIVDITCPVRRRQSSNTLRSTGGKEKGLLRCCGEIIARQMPASQPSNYHP